MPDGLELRFRSPELVWWRHAPPTLIRSARTPWELSEDMNHPSMVTAREVRQTIVERAITHGTLRYICAREQQIDAFVKRHYTLRGALNIHAHALGWDLIRVPVNILWSVVNIVLALVACMAKVMRVRRLHAFIQRIPPGLATDMEKEIRWLRVTELLELPHQDGSRRSDTDALMEEVMNDPALRRLLDEALEGVVPLKDTPKFRAALDSKLAEYGVTRTGAADLASNVVLLVSSTFALGQASFGALSAGSAVSASVAKTIASAHCWWGPTAGSYVYAVAPVAVSMRLLIAVTGMIAIMLAFVSTFMGIVTDPLQATLGVHQRRLRKLVKAVEQDLLGQSAGPFQLRAKYLGRVFDVVDFLACMGRSV